MAVNSRIQTTRSYRTRFPYCVIMLSMLTVLLGCGSGSDPAEIKPAPVTPEIAKEITYATSGTILTTDPIRVQFSKRHVAERQAGSPVERNQPVFNFTPWIDGQIRWNENGRTLEFRPKAPLPRNTAFSCALDLNVLFPQKEGKPDLGQFTFEFRTGRQEVSTITGQFGPAPSGNADRVVYTGSITLTEPAELSTLKEATRITLDDKPVDAVWSIREDKRRFSFTVQDIRRDNKKHELRIVVEGTPLEATETRGHVSTLYPAHKLELTRIRGVSDRNARTAMLAFSDRLDPSQSLEGFIRVQPDIPFAIRKKDKTVTLVGGFQPGQSYRIHVEPGVRSIWGNETSVARDEEVRFSFLKPRIRFVSDGMFLPTANNRRIRFEATNIKSVDAEVLRIFESNLGQYLQRANLDNTRDRNDSFNESNRVAVKVAEKKLDLDLQANQRQTYDLDLSDLLHSGTPGLFLVHLSFDRESMVYDTAEPDGSYYEDPRRPGYLWRHGNIYKAVLLSDIGLSYQHAGPDHVVFATHLATGKPYKNVNLLLKTYQNQIIASGKTDDKGIARFTELDESVFYVEAEKNNMISVVPGGSMGWNTSTFDTGGKQVAGTGIRSFIYPDRGVHRPGDTIHLSVIARNESGTFPDDHPITLKLTNPKRQTALEETVTAKKDGFATFTFSTREDAPTGTWNAAVTIGDSTFNHALPIETVVPYRLKISLETDQPDVKPDDSQWQATLHADYLFGNPAPGLDARAEIKLSTSRPPVKGFSGFRFEDESVRFNDRTIRVFSGKLNEKADAVLNWQVPDLGASPGMLEGRLTATVLEKGGRPNRTDMRMPVHPFSRYVGIQPPDFKWGYAPVGQPIEAQLIVVDTDGNPVSGQPLQWTLYHNERSWWWEYRSWSDYKQKYRDDFRTTAVAEGSLSSNAIPTPLVLEPGERGSYLLEVRNGDGHKSAFFFNAYAWGEANSPGSATTMTMDMDRPGYKPGDTATLSFPTPKEGTILVTVIKGNHILSAFRAQPSGTERTEIQIPVNRDMIPNAYVTVSVIQPHSVTVNDRPIRMFGIRNIPVSDPETRLGLEIQMPDELESGKPFTVQVQAADRKPARFTIAVVDEGLLALTRHRTPDPWGHFFAKQGLSAVLADLYDQVINAMRGDPFQVFAIGGDAARLARQAGAKPEEDAKRRRFKPVALFKGPVETDRNGRGSVSFTMPEYIGAVRVMVVAARREAYGSVDKTVPVKQDLMLLPTLPRILHPGDRIQIPVTVFAMRDGLGDVRISVDTEGPLSAKLLGGDIVTMPTTGERDIQITLTVGQALGPARIQIRAEGTGATTRTETDLSIMPVSPEITEWSTRSISPGQSLTIPIPDHGLEGSNRVELRVAKRAGLNIAHRVNRLIRYPYGCVEQTTSAALPQLYLKHLTALSEEQEARIDDHINRAIDRLRRFQVSSGGFSYWPGHSDVNAWCSSYVGRFLLEADRAGYYVPAEMKDRWLAYEQRSAGSATGSLRTRCYRVYLLAHAGQPEMGAMNLLKENSLKSLSNTDRWLLAGAYQLAGLPDISDDILGNAGLDIPAYRETGGTYGSAYRDRAILLEIATTMEKWDRAATLFEQVADRLSGKDWLSTQEAGYALGALGQFILATDRDNAPLIGQFRLPDGTVHPFDTDALMVSVPVPEGSGEQAVVELDKNCTIETARLTVHWTGVPVNPEAVQEAHNGIQVHVRWLDEDGREIDPTGLKQGTVFYAHYRIQLDRALGTIEEVVLNQMLPSLWEIENTRLNGGNMPDWGRSFPAVSVEYTDIRDDRVSWFFDLYSHRRNHVHLIQKLRAVTAGSSQLPPTVCEAMYDNRYSSVIPGKKVTVSPRK